MGIADQRMGLGGEPTRRVDERGHWRAIAERKRIRRDMKSTPRARLEGIRTVRFPLS